MFLNNLVSNFKKLYFYRLFRAFYRLSRAFWQQRRSNFIGVVITSMTVLTFFGAELYADFRWLSARQLLKVYSSVPFSSGTDFLTKVPAQTLSFIEEIGFDNNGGLNVAAFVAKNEALQGFAPLAASRRPAQKFINWPALTSAEAETVPAVATMPVKAARANRPAPSSAPEETATTAQPVTPNPPTGTGRYYWVTAPKVAPRRELHYGPTPTPVASGEVSASSGEQRERRAGSAATLAANNDW